MQKVKYVLYNILNTVNNSVYVGITKNLKRRWQSHKYNFNKKKSILYYAMRKYGIDKFYIKQIEEFDDLHSACKQEIYWIDKLKQDGVNLYNITNGGEGSLGVQRFGSNNPNYRKQIKPHVKESLLTARRKLSNDKIKEIIKLYPKYTQTELSKMFNVSLTQIHRIVHGKSWGNKNHDFILTKKNISNDVKLTIIEMYKTGKYKKIELAKIFNLSPSRITRLLK